MAASVVYDAIVVGCGASGLAALARLAAGGARALGLEAAARRGGRVHTVHMGGAVELGAEWIHGEVGNAVYQLAREHSLPITKDEISFDVRRSNGSVADRALCDQLLQYCWAVKETAEHSDRAVGHYVTEKFYEYVKDMPISLDADFCENFLHLLNLISNNYDATDDWTDITLAGAAQYVEPEGHLHWSFNEMGYETLFALLEKDNRLDVRLNSEVDLITRTADGVSVRCAGGAVYRARHVVVTASLGVLKERHATLFAPPLPASKVRAIDEISMGVMDKICLQYARAWWPHTRKFFGFLWRGEDRSRVDEWMTKILGFSVAAGARNVITLWTSGETAKLVEIMPEDEVLRGCKTLLQMFMGPSIVVPDPVGFNRSTWYSDPLTRGSYSFRRHKMAAASDLAEPVLDAGRPVLLFAGEACSEHHYSTVHGAVETGTRAADLILQHVKKLRSKM